MSFDPAASSPVLAVALSASPISASAVNDPTNGPTLSGEFIDTFTASNGTLLDNHTANTGQNWNIHSSDPGQLPFMEIIDGTVRLDANGGAGGTVQHQISDTAMATRHTKMTAYTTRLDSGSSAFGTNVLFGLGATIDLEAYLVGVASGAVSIVRRLNTGGGATLASAVFAFGVGVPHKVSLTTIPSAASHNLIVQVDDVEIMNINHGIGAATAADWIYPTLSMSVDNPAWSVDDMTVEELS